MGGDVHIPGAGGAEAKIELEVPPSSPSLSRINQSDASMACSLLWEVVEATQFRAKGLAAPRVVRSIQDRLCHTMRTSSITRLHDFMQMPELAGALHSRVGERATLLDAVWGCAARCLLAGDVGDAVLVVQAIRDSGASTGGLDAVERALCGQQGHQSTGPTLDEILGNTRLSRIALRGEANAPDDEELDEDEVAGIQLGLRRCDVLDSSIAAKEAVRSRAQVRRSMAAWVNGVRADCTELGIQVADGPQAMMPSSGAGSANGPGIGVADVGLVAAGMLRLLAGDLQQGMEALTGLPVLSDGAIDALSEALEGVRGGAIRPAQVAEAVQYGGGIELLQPAWTHYFVCGMVLGEGRFALASGDGVAGAIRVAIDAMGDDALPTGLPEACASACEGVMPKVLEWMLGVGAIIPTAQLAMLLQGVGHIAPSGLTLAEGGGSVLARYGVGMRDTLVLDAAHEIQRLIGLVGTQPRGIAEISSTGAAAPPQVWSLGFHYALLCTDAASDAALAIASCMLSRQCLESDGDVSAAVQMAADAGLDELALELASRRGQAWLDRRRLDCSLRWFALSKDMEGLWRVGQVLLALLLGPAEQPTMAAETLRRIEATSLDEKAALSRDLSQERRRVDAIALAYACLILRPLLPGKLGSERVGSTEAETWCEPAGRTNLCGHDSQAHNFVGAARNADPPEIGTKAAIDCIVGCPILLTCLQVACFRLSVADAASAVRSAQRLPDASLGFTPVAHRRWFGGTAVASGLGPVACTSASASADAQGHVGMIGSRLAVDMHRTAAGRAPLACATFLRQGAAADVSPDRDSGGAEWVRRGCLRRAAVALCGLVCGDEAARCPRVLVVPLLVRARHGGLLGASPCPFTSSDALGLVAAVELLRGEAERGAAVRRGARAGTGPGGKVPGGCALLGVDVDEIAIKAAGQGRTDGDALAMAARGSGGSRVSASEEDEDAGGVLDDIALAVLGGVSRHDFEGLVSSLLDCVVRATLQEADGSGPREQDESAHDGVTHKFGPGSSSPTSVLQLMWETCRGPSDGPQLFSEGGREHTLYEGCLPPVGAIAVGSAAVVGEGQGRGWGLRRDARGTPLLSGSGNKEPASGSEPTEKGQGQRSRDMGMSGVGLASRMYGPGPGPNGSLAEGVPSAEPWLVSPSPAARSKPQSAMRITRGSSSGSGGAGALHAGAPRAVMSPLTGGGGERVRRSVRFGEGKGESGGSQSAAGNQLPGPGPGPGPGPRSGSMLGFGSPRSVGGGLPDAKLDVFGFGFADVDSRTEVAMSSL